MPFNPLALLMGQQSAAGAVPEELNEILVQAPQGRPTAVAPDYADAPARDQIQPRYVLNDDRIAPRPEELDEIVPRKGMFGVKGTLRDVLGTLGDAFLVQSGRDTVYRPQRLREQMGDAMFGASDDPYQAAERLASQGFVKEAQELIEQTQRNEYQQGMLSSTEGARQDQANNRREDNLTILRNLTARRLQAAGDDPDKVAYALQLAEQDAQRLGITVNDLGINPNMTPAQRAVVAGGDMTVNQQVQIPFTERRVATGEKNAESARISATRPRNPPPRPRADTDQEYFRDISQVPPNERTAEENQWMDMYINGRSRGGRSDGRRDVSPAPRQGWGTVTRGD